MPCRAFNERFLTFLRIYAYLIHIRLQHHSCKVNVGLNTHELFIVSGVRFPQTAVLVSHFVYILTPLHSLGSTYVYFSFALARLPWQKSFSNRFTRAMTLVIKEIQNENAPASPTQNDFGNFACDFLFRNRNVKKFRFVRIDENFYYSTAHSKRCIRSAATLQQTIHTAGVQCHVRTVNIEHTSQASVFPITALTIR